MASGPAVARALAAYSSEGPTYYAEDQAGFGATQAGPGSLPVLSGDTQPSDSVPNSIFDLPFDVDVTDGDHVVEGVLPRTQAVGPNFGRGKARNALDHIYLNCKDSCKENRRFDDLMLPVPMRNQTFRDGAGATFDSEDVWRCFLPKFTEREEFQDRCNPFCKIKQSVDGCQFWSAPPGSARPAVQVNGKRSAKEQGRGR